MAREVWLFDWPGRAVSHTGGEKHVCPTLTTEGGGGGSSPSRCWAGPRLQSHQPMAICPTALPDSCSEFHTRRTRRQHPRQPRLNCPPGRQLVRAEVIRHTLVLISFPGKEDGPTSPNPEHVHCGIPRQLLVVVLLKGGINRSVPAESFN